MNASLTITLDGFVVVLYGTFTEYGCTFTAAGYVLVQVNNAPLPAGFEHNIPMAEFLGRFAPNTMATLNVPANREFHNTPVRILGTNGNVIRLQTA